MEWKNFNEQRPADGQRCLVCDKYHQEVTIMVYNENCECWDDAEGDDWYRDFDDVEYWTDMPPYHY